MPSRFQPWGVVCVLVLLLALVAGALAKGDHSPEKTEEPPDVGAYADESFGPDASAFLLFNFSGHDFGIGGTLQFAYPAFPRGFISHESFPDALHVEGGLEILHWWWDAAGNSYSLTVFAPNIGVRYLVYLFKHFGVFACLKIGAGFGVDSGASSDSAVSFYWSTSLGVLVDLLDNLSIRVEWGWGSYRDALRLGVLFRF